MIEIFLRQRKVSRDNIWKIMTNRKSEGHFFYFTLETEAKN